METKMKEKIRIIADHYMHKYGIGHQLVKATEEFGELIQAVAKYHHAYVYGDANEKAAVMPMLREEIADVLCMIEQIRYFSGCSDEQIEKECQKKIERQLKRIGGWNEKDM